MKDYMYRKANGNKISKRRYTQLIQDFGGEEGNTIYDKWGFVVAYRHENKSEHYRDHKLGRL